MSRKRLHCILLSYLGWTILLAGLSGCPGTAWEAVRESKDVDELREFIQDHPNDPQAGDARLRIAEIEYRQAKAAGNRFAYNSFLERHGNTSFALDVRRLLEDLDYQRAEKAGDEDSLQHFLNSYPQGRNADKARRKLEAATCARWRATSNAETLAAFLDGQAGISCADILQSRLKELRLAQALADGDMEKLIGLVQAYGADPAIGQARELLLERQVAALRLGGRFDQARRWAESRANADRLDPLLRAIDLDRQAWRCAEFGLPSGDRDTRSQQAICRKVTRSGQQTLRRLSEAAAHLLGSRDLPPASVDPASDPRKRWLLAARMARADTEEVADKLLELQADSFIQVRLRAHESLLGVVERLGPVRRPMWLFEQRKRLEKKAQSGVLLLRLAIVYHLQGETARALTLLQQVAREGEETDLFALYLAASIAADLNREREAASLARHFSGAAQAYAVRRMEAWAARGLRGGDSGWLSLRQLHGLINLWQRVLAPFHIRADGRPALGSFASVNGPWLSASEENLNQLVRWFRDEERRWSRTHKGYADCADTDADGVRGRDDSRRAALDLAAGGGRTALPLLAWASLHHPDPQTRQAAILLLLASRIQQSLAPLAWFASGP